MSLNGGISKQVRLLLTVGDSTRTAKLLLKLT